MAINTKYFQLQPFSLAGAGSNIGDVVLILNSFLDINGNAITMSEFGSVGFGTIDPGNGLQEEQISFTGVTNNTNGTSTLTGVSTVLFDYPYTQTSGMTKTHVGGAVFVISNTAGFYNQFAAVANDETVTGTWTFPNDSTTPLLGSSYVAPTLQNQVASKGYVDATAIAGAPNASTTVQGLVQEATVTQVNAGTATGSTGAVLFASPADLASSIYGVQLPTANQKAALVGTGTPNGTTGKYVTLDTATSTYQILSSLTTDPLMGGSSPSTSGYPSEQSVKQYTDLQFVMSTIFETTGRFTHTNVSAGTQSFGTVGLVIDTTSTTTSSTRIQWSGVAANGTGDSIINGNPLFITGINLQNIGTAGAIYTGLGTCTVAGTGITFTTRHIGFKIVFTAGPTATLYATQGDATTENASSSLTTLLTTDDIEVALRVNGTSSVDYFWRKNGGTWSAATNLTANFPSTAITSDIEFSVSNASTATQNTANFYSATYKR